MSVLLVGLMPLGLAVIVSILTRVSVVLSELLGFVVATRVRASLPEGEQPIPHMGYVEK